jgi:hypothetical protein
MQVAEESFGSAADYPGDDGRETYRAIPRATESRRSVPFNTVVYDYAPKSDSYSPKSYRDDHRAPRESTRKSRNHMAYVEYISPDRGVDSYDRRRDMPRESTRATRTVPVETQYIPKRSMSQREAPPPRTMNLPIRGTVLRDPTPPRYIPERPTERYTAQRHVLQRDEPPSRYVSTRDTVPERYAPPRERRESMDVPSREYTARESPRYESERFGSKYEEGRWERPSVRVKRDMDYETRPHMSSRRYEDDLPPRRPAERRRDLDREYSSNSRDSAWARDRHGGSADMFVIDDDRRRR